MGAPLNTPDDRIIRHLSVSKDWWDIQRAGVEFWRYARKQDRHKLHTTKGDKSED